MSEKIFERRYTELLMTCVPEEALHARMRPRDIHQVAIDSVIAKDNRIVELEAEDKRLRIRADDAELRLQRLQKATRMYLGAFDSASDRWRTEGLLRALKESEDE